jgi:uncharacterized alkaline shock family protein YloU
VTLTITEAARAQVVTHAAEQVEGVRVRRRGVTWNGDDVALQVSARHGIVLPDAARDVQRRVQEAARTMLALELARIDVAVEELDDE